MRSTHSTSMGAMDRGSAMAWTRQRRRRRESSRTLRLGLLRKTFRSHLATRLRTPRTHMKQVTDLATSTRSSADSNCELLDKRWRLNTTDDSVSVAQRYGVTLGSLR